MSKNSRLPRLKSKIVQQTTLHICQSNPDLGIKGGWGWLTIIVFLLSFQFQITKSRISFYGERKPVLDLGF